MKGKLIIFSAPSGSGKSTIIEQVLKVIPNLQFSISATSRAPRGEEKNGVEYYFLSQDQFKAKADADLFLEWEEVYAGTCYGTLKEEVERIRDNQKHPIFDIDVVGGSNVKSFYGDDAISIFIKPPSIEELERRLRGRATDTEEAITKRLGKAKRELEFESKFDVTVINDNLDKAVADTIEVINNFISK